MYKILTFPLVLLIRFYQYVISPLLGPHCRYTPTCSSYAIKALQRFGLFKGFYLASKRILSCHPWTEGGDDPVPEKNKSDRIKSEKSKQDQSAQTCHSCAKHSESK